MDSTPTPSGSRFSHGLRTAWGADVAVAERLDSVFRSWAGPRAVDYSFPPVVSVGSMHTCDYFRSFPHLGTFVAPVARERLGELATTLSDARSDAAEPASAEPGTVEPCQLEPAQLDAAEFMLAPSACYAAFDHFAGQTVPSPFEITLVSPCFRREESYAEGTRQWHFTMREIVCFGESDVVAQFLSAQSDVIRAKLDAAGLPFTHRAATDPFFRADDPKLVLQKLAPVKHEFLDDEGVALSSVNFHRNFFGERFDIRLPTGEPAFSGCVGFGIERWQTACVRAFGVDPAHWPDVLSP